MSDSEGPFIFLASIFFKLLLFPTKFSTDFEVHRNWLAITSSLPWWKWYTTTGPSQWTLDYPPLFAWFEWVLGFPAQLFDPEMLKLSNLSYASQACIVFQKSSVILADCMLAWSLFQFEASHRTKTSLQLVLFLPGLLIVDHMHFQYNGFLLGFFILSLLAFKLVNDSSSCPLTFSLINLGCLVKHKFLLGTFFFVLLINLKHLFLYFAPAVGIYLLSGYVLRQWKFKSILNSSLAIISIVMSIMLVSLGPFIWAGQGKLLFERLFPLKRGIVHSYWAPNFWAAYAALDIISVHVFNYIWPGSVTVGSKLTNGMVEEKLFSVLPSITPIACVLLTLATQCIQLSRLVKRPTPLVFHRSMLISGFASFLFGWHVHEKASIALVLLAFLLWPTGIATSSLLWVYWSSMLSLLPLLNVTMERTLGLVLIVAWSFSFYSESFVPSPILKLYIMGGIIVHVMGIVSISYPIFKHWEFLPLILASMYSTLGLLYSFIRLQYEFRLANQPKPE